MPTNRYFRNAKVTLFITSAVLSLVAIAATNANSSSISIVPQLNPQRINLPDDSSQAIGQIPITQDAPVILAQSGLNNIAVELETQNRTFSTLATALKVTGLNQTLAEGGPFTIFAPTDEAFAILERNQPGTLESLFQPENRDQLTRILLYHVVRGTADTFEMRPGTQWTLETLAGDIARVPVDRNFEITVESARPAIGDPAKVILVDIPATNGVIHGIDSVLIPPN